MAATRKPSKPTTTDKLLKPTKKNGIELKEDEIKEDDLKNVTGGTGLGPGWGFDHK